MNLEMLEEDTGCGRQILRGNYGNDVFLNLEIPNGRESHKIKGLNLKVPPRIVNINVMVPISDSPENIAEGMVELAKVRDLMKEKGYDGKFERNEDLIEYVYEIPYADNKSLNRILRQVSQIDGIGSGSPDKQLEQLFAGRLDERTLDGLVSDVDAELKKVTLDTGSIGVVSFESDGKKGYGKISTSKPALMNEEKALDEIQSIPISRVLAPVPIGLALEKDAGAMFTWSTENKDLHNKEDINQYFSIYNTLLFQYAQERNLDLAKLANDTTFRDVFNRAIINTAINDYESLNPIESVHEIGVLEERASNDNDLLKLLRKHNSTYIEASSRINDLDKGKLVFLHGDARPENIGKDGYGIRPLVDWTNARMGSFAEDFSALELKDSPKYLDWYKFVAGFRGFDVGDDASDLLLCYDVLQPYRTGSFKIDKGRVEEAMGDILRLGRNAEKYEQRFK